MARPNRAYRSRNHSQRIPRLRRTSSPEISGMKFSRCDTRARIDRKKNSSHTVVWNVVPANKQLRFLGTPIGRDQFPLLSNVFA